MKTIIVILALAAFAFAANAGSDCCPKSKEAQTCPAKGKQTCPGKEGQCPSGGDQKKEEKKS